MKAMLFAAGLGTRLKPFTDHHPKALAEVNGKTLLEINILYLQSFGIEEVVVNVHHFAGQIKTVIAENDGFGSKVLISDESDEVLETGGGLKKAIPFFQDEEAILVMNVDVLSNIDLSKLIAAHHSKNAFATLAVMQRNSSRQLLFNESMQLCGWENTGTGQKRIAREEEPLTRLAFSGIQVISAKLLKSISQEGKFSLIDVYLHAAKTENIQGYDHTGDVFLDVGKPESLEQAACLFGDWDNGPLGLNWFWQ